MLLPSGRSNSDVYPLQNGQKPPPFLTRTSSPLLPALAASATLGGSSAGAAAAAATVAAATVATADAGTATRVAENGLPAPTPSTANTKALSTSTVSPGSQSESGTDRISTFQTFLEQQSATAPKPTTATTTTGTTTTTTGTATTGTTTTTTTTSSSHSANTGNWKQIDRHLEAVQRRLKEGWTAHVGKEGRLYYCNHLTQTSSWLPSCEDWSCSEQLPYGWERAVDSKGRSYYINHINKSSTYEAPETVRSDENPPEPRVAVLQRSPTLGFGFVAGSERPVIVRFVTEGGPSINKLQPGDQILAVNGEDVKEAPRDHVIQLVRACETKVTLLVCQPARHTSAPGRKSTLLSAGKRAKLKSRPSRVRFAESVCVNGAPLFPPSAFSLGDICVPPMANVLKVFLENGQTKSFKYDATTSVQDVVASLLDKLCLSTGEIFSLVLEHVKSLRRNKLTLLDPEESLARIAARPGAHKLRCLFRVSFVPTSAAELAQKDLNALDYLYMQCCNDVTQERFAPELQPEVALRLAALHIHQHALANNVSPAKLTVKIVEREFGLERFVPTSLFEGMKRKELRRLVSHFLKLNAEMTGSSAKVLTQLQAKLHYLDIIAGLPSYGAKCFSTNQREGVERVLLVSPRFGLSQISSARNSVPQPISTIEDFSHVLVRREDDVTCSVAIFMRGEHLIKFSMEDRDACEFSLVLAGYYRLLTGRTLPVDRERVQQYDEDVAPSYLAQHTVLPADWSYLQPFHNRAHSVNFLMLPPYHPLPLDGAPKARAEQELVAVAVSPEPCDRNMNSAYVANSNHKPKKVAFFNSSSTDLDMHSVMATELLEEAKDSGLSDSSGGGSNTNYFTDERVSHTSAFIEAKNEEVLRRVHEMQRMVENSEQYLTEQGEQLNEYAAAERRSSGNDNSNFGVSNSWARESPATAAAPNVAPEFDSDCDSLNSSKVSSSEDAPQPGALKHSDSLVLLSEAINQDLSGITKGLNSIGSSQKSLEPPACSISATCSPRPERKLNGFGQLLSNLQALGNDYSQSESDSESVQSPTNSPTTRRPSLLQPGDLNTNRKRANAYRCSFGLHSPDGSNFGAETKDYNLKEYLMQLKEISKVDDAGQDTDVAAKKLSEIYGFEIREDTFIETDSDLIDLRALPPPQTPDELDALSLLNAAPHGFADSSGGRKNVAPEAEADLDRFLAKVVVAPPTQKATPAKELTPEEIMSFIIPPPPNLDAIERSRQDPQQQQQQQHATSKPNRFHPEDESLYSNSASTQGANAGSPSRQQKPRRPEEAARQRGVGHVIEYATVERKSKFSCCPKSKKEEVPAADCVDSSARESLQLPPRRGSQNSETAPPVRPPKSAELISRYSPKKHPLALRAPQPAERNYADSNERPPVLPPRTSPTQRSCDELCTPPPVSLAPKKPPLPPTANRPAHQLRNPNAPPTPAANGSAPPTLPRSVVRPSANGSHLSTFHSPNALHSNEQLRTKADCPPICPRTPPPTDRRPSLSLLCSPQMSRKTYHQSPSPTQQNSSCGRPLPHGDRLIIKNGHVIDGEVLLAKTDVAMAGLLVKLDQVAAQCTAAQAAGGGASINEEKFQRARNELTEQTLALVTASKFLVMAMSDLKLATLPEHLTSCLTAIRRITELTQDMTRHTSAPLQTRNIVLKVHDVTSSFRELVGVQIGPLGAGQLALQAECLANMLATLLRSLRVFSP